MNHALKPPEVIAYLTNHRDDYEDEIPEEVVSGIGNDKGDAPRYKVQKNWFQGIVGCLDNAQYYQLISSDELGQCVDAFIARITSDDFKGRLTTRDDIDAANQIINDVIAHLLGVANASQ